MVYELNVGTRILDILYLSHRRPMKSEKGELHVLSSLLLYDLDLKEHGAIRGTLNHGTQESPPVG